MNTVDCNWPRVVSDHDEKASPENSESTFGFIQLSKVKEQPVDWRWEGFLPMGKLIVLEGEPGTKKTFITADITARITTGEPFPGENDRRRPGNVLLLNREDAPEDTLKPRVRVAGGDLDRVYVLPTGPQGFLSLPDDIQRIRTMCIEKEIKLVVIDPISSFASNGLSCEHRAREILDQLADVARETNAMILVVRHWTKSKSSNKLNRGLGSIGVTGAARVVLTVEPHPMNKEISVLSVIKGNIGGDKRQIGFTLLGDQGQQPRIAWGAEVIGTAGETDFTSEVNEDDDGGFPFDFDDERSSTIRRAAILLSEILAEGGIAASDCFSLAKEYGISVPTLRRASKLLGVASVKVGRGWEWQLPAPHQQSLALEGDLLGDHLHAFPPGPEIKALPPAKVITEVSSRETRTKRIQRRNVWRIAIFGAMRRRRRCRRTR